MAKLGISVRIDVTKILKERLYKGAKGTYLDLTTFIDTDQADQYDNHGFISQSVTKEEREQKTQTPILGNCKVFFNDQQAQQQHAQQQAPQPQQQRQAPPQGGPYGGGVQQAPQQGQQNQGYDDDLPW